MRSPCLLVLLGCPWHGKHGQGMVKDGSQSVARYKPVPIMMTQGDRLTGEEGRTRSEERQRLIRWAGFLLLDGGVLV